MHFIDKAYIDGAFVTVSGTEVVEIVNPATEQVIGHARLGNREDARGAIAAALRAQPALARTGEAERIDMLDALRAAVLARKDDIRDVTIEEYGAPLARARFVGDYASAAFAYTAEALAACPLTRRAGAATVRMEPVGPSALIAPWNSTIGTMCSKLASAIAAGCTSVIKPSEQSPLQVEVISEALHAAGLPAGTFNVVMGRGGDVGDELSTSPAIARISFTGSTVTGKVIARAAAETFKRVGLSLSGKSASIILSDADFGTAMPLALDGAFGNNGQACIAGTRILVPRARLAEVNAMAKSAVARLHVGDPRDEATGLGPLASQAQFDRVQRYIRRGLEQGATLVAGGEGRPAGLARGFFARPTVFTDVRNEMDIAQEEIFGPVAAIVPYDTEADAVRLANDSAYGLQAYIFSTRPDRAATLAAELQAGSVLINTIKPDLRAPFGGVKHSGVGREFGVFGIEAFLEAKTILV